MSEHIMSPQDPLPTELLVQKEVPPCASPLDKENWAPSLQEKYEALPIPSLYDFLLSQEKLGVEIRKQNRDLQQLRIHIEQNHQILKEMHSSIEISQEEEEEEIPEKIFEENIPLEKEYCILMEAMDALFHLTQATATTTQELRLLVPNPRSFFTKKKPQWRRLFEETVEGYSSGIEMIQAKMLKALAEAGIQIIQPYPNDPFEAEKHRAIERVSGKEPYTIAKTVRYGYQKGNRVLRVADVIIYY